MLQLREMMRCVILCAAVAACLYAGDARGEWTYFANHSDIRALHESGDTLWVGTNGGVLLVDRPSGQVMRRLTAADGLAGNSVRTFLERAGKMYVGTDDGLTICRRGRGGAMSCETVGSYVDVRHVSFGRSGTMYVGTYGRGVALVQKQRARWITTADSLLDGKVFAVQEAGENAVYYATSMGLCARLDSAWVSFQAGAGLPRGEILDLAEASPNAPPGASPVPDYYVLVEGRGIYRFDGRRARTVSPVGIFRGDDVVAIAVSPDGTLWSAGRYGGIAKYRDDVWTTVGEADSVVAASLWRSAHVGASGAAYFGSSDGVVAVADDRGVRAVFFPSDIPGGHIGPMAEDETGRKYIACGGYLISLENNSGALAVEKDFGSVLAIQVSPSGDVWLASRWGLYRRTPGGWSEAAPDIDPPPLFTSLAFDSSGALWAGTRQGEVYRFDRQVWLRVAEREDLGGEPVDGLTVGSDGGVWAFSRSVGVFGFDGSGWKRFEGAQFDSTGVVDILVGPSGGPVVLTRNSLWTHTARGGWQPLRLPIVGNTGDYSTLQFDRAGTTYLGASKGLALVRNGVFKWVGPREGLRGKDVSSILIDRNGALWVGFRKDGISRILLEKLW